MPDISPASVVPAADDAVRRWMLAGERGDAAAATDCTSHDVELASPVTDGLSFRGHDQIHALLTSVFATVSDIRYHTVLSEGDTRALFYKGRVGNHDFEMVQWMRLDANGLIREMRMFGRPLPGLTSFLSSVGPAMAAQRGSRVLTAVVLAATSALRLISGVGDRRLVPLIDPNRT